MCRSDLGGGRVVFSSPPGNESAARRGLLEKMPTFRLGYDVGSQRLWIRAVRQDSRPWRKWTSAPRRLPVTVSAVLQIAQRRMDPAGALWTMLYLPWTKEASGVFRFLFLRGCRLRRWGGHGSVPNKTSIKLASHRHSNIPVTSVMFHEVGLHIAHPVPQALAVDDYRQQWRVEMTLGNERGCPDTVSVCNATPTQLPIQSCEGQCGTDRRLWLRVTSPCRGPSPALRSTLATSSA